MNNTFLAGYRLGDDEIVYLAYAHPEKLLEISGSFKFLSAVVIEKDPKMDIPKSRSLFDYLSSLEDQEKIPSDLILLETKEVMRKLVLPTGFTRITGFSFDKEFLRRGIKHFKEELELGDPDPIYYQIAEVQGIAKSDLR